MRSSFILGCVAIAAATTLGWAAHTAISPAQDGGGMPAPGPEHKGLEKYAGTWDAVVEGFNPDGSAGEKSTGTMTSKVVCGGFWLVSDFATTMMGGPFTGHETMGYDPADQKYHVCWVDSWTPSLTIGAGTFDAATKTMKIEMNGKDMTGQPSTFLAVDAWKDADHREWSMLTKGPDGKYAPMMKISYTRRK